MVRLRAVVDKAINGFDMFQFQYGAIKSPPGFNIQ